MVHLTLILGEISSTPVDWGMIALIGLIAGLLGGLLGVGGSIVMLPALSWVFGYDQHLYQASAMVANVAVSLPAAWKHHQAGTVHWKVVRYMLPAAVVFAFIGVFVSNLPIFAGREGGLWLGRLLALFLVYVIGLTFWKIFQKAEECTLAEYRDSRSASGLLGAMMGFVAGLLGIGGGVLAVPMQQVILKLPLRVCIANSATVIVVSAALGAIYKIASLPGQGHSWHKALMVGLMLVPGAFLGGRLGAVLTYKLSLSVVRILFIALMLVAAWKMAAFGQ